ncbi:MAG TPA: histidine phosphatase family protein [Solirubrobacteraceae bacterium]|jgi:probable phosphoglycerate mutase|nr:histidine phosphatase family protein [Solirubrobacteraceae bacterium]
MSDSPEVLLIRHAATEWSVAGRHTGRTDLPLTEEGKEAAARTARKLEGQSFERVLSSPLRRARETCEICGLGAQAQTVDQLVEWDYGEYEGLTTAQIRELRPGWNLWRDGCPGGENTAQVGARADAVIAMLQTLQGQVAIFAHGHILRVLAARWIAAEPALGARLMLSTGALSVLGYEHGVGALRRWNECG